MSDSSSSFSKALIVGLARDISKQIQNGNLEKLKSEIANVMDCDFLVIESDSSDSTVDDLKKLQDRGVLRFISLGNLSETFPNRLDRIRYCRNYYVKEIRENIHYINHDLIIVADLDGVNNSFESKSLRSGLSKQTIWDICCANQSKNYYDIFALRHNQWNPVDCYKVLKWYEQYESKRNSFRKAVLDKMIKIPIHSDPIFVNSAFGGLTLNKRWIFENFDYEDKENPEECEHVILCSRVIASGGKIVIDPSMVNAGWTTHSNYSRLPIRILSAFPRFKRIQKIRTTFFGLTVR